jgi:alkanesulfonate monooxygenase SsuD/methylene tetrahydromethanopterin reductase-like flavin-dependent oxidoreductase (luciferase family)
LNASPPLRFGIVLGQRAPWPELAERAREVEALGFDSLYVVDHFYGLRDVEDPTHEAYTILAGFALVTERVRLGVMVCGNTYRNPAFLLKQAVTVDHMSGGRVDFGVGAGWLEREHEAYGFPFPAAGERVDMFAEALEVWDLLHREERTTYDGRFYQLLDAPFAPKPVQTRLPVLIGASLPRMLRLTARHADIWNARGDPAEAAAGNERLTTLCREIGRDPATILRGISPSLNLLASAGAFAEGVAAYRAAGFADFQIPWPRSDEEHAVLRAVAAEVIPELRGSADPAPSFLGPRDDPPGA